MSRQARRVAIGCVMHETNSFNRRATRLEDFGTRYLLRGEELWDLAHTNTEIAGFLDEARQQGWQTVPLVAATCAPSGPLAQEAWSELLADLLARLMAAAPVDGVLLGLHGAMMTESEPDAEAVLLESIRNAVGENTPIVATLDMHANVSPRMVAASDALVAYRSYPHVDQFDTGRRGAQLLAERLEGATFTSALRQPALLDTAAHGRTSPPGPMNELLAEAEAFEAEPGIACVSLQIGFPWSDFPYAGPSVVVSGSDPQRCAAVADFFSRRYEALIHTVELDYPDAKQAVAEAMRAPGEGPVVLADFADNPSGGAYGDSPMLLRALVEAKATRTVFATLCDECSVARAEALGVGAHGTFTLGGRWAPELTPPMEVEAEVVCLSDGLFTCEGPMWTGTRQSLGPSARLRIGGVDDIDVIVTSRALAVTDRNLLRLFGIEPANVRLLALKSRNHCRAAFAPLAQSYQLVDAGGIASMRLASLPYRQLRRPVWPLDPIDHE
ncbi:M81 family metallopeptidase [Billgrantia kenyensis]|uniref:Microcystinase C n=1 Tax=Billgrantia kenyensis TaxID=321266 RepID=A0A7V9W2Y0_9GAMM|nr:M81 family metallopeptidase [Halomonas kenyensis]MBA2780089.1 M81 family metallopeptidase [Halomonas kenyensis]MCG6661962.1 M81 family metallopeptidase [Halomonas kenyensis]